jgi:hypothetical protein
MIHLWKNITNSPVLRVALLSAVLSGVGCFVVWDYTRVDRDCRQLKSLLMDARCLAVGQSGQDKILVVRFIGDSVSVAEKDNGKEGVVIKL